MDYAAEHVAQVGRSLINVAIRQDGPNDPVSAETIEYALCRFGIELPGVEILKARVAAMEARPDYRLLLKKYMRHVETEEGVTFVGRGMSITWDMLTDDEKAELRRIESTLDDPDPVAE